MLLRYFYDEKLAHASYLVGCQATGEAVIVDPMRNILPYIATAKAENVKIVGALETHIHADFVSGSRELANRFDATLYISDEGGEDWTYQNLDTIKHQLLKDGDVFKIGNLVFETMHTPGHTPESISFLLTDRGGKADKPMGIFSGDFVFVGDIGRPDLLEKAAGMTGTAEAGAKVMYHSVERFKELPDYLQVWPAHGAGSACGKALGAVPSSTVGYEKRFNWAMHYDNQQTFMDDLLNGQPEPPYYFAIMKHVNKVGIKLLKELPSLKTISSFKEVQALIEQGVQVIDTRQAGSFANAHIEGTINIPFNKSITNWAGWLVNYEQPLYLLTNPKHLDEILIALRSIGIDNVMGYGDITNILLNLPAQPSLESYDSVTPLQIAESVANGDVHVLDVRNQSEWNQGHIEGAQHIMIGTLIKRMNEIIDDKQIIVQCQSGVRSAIATSVLQAQGKKNCVNLLGGYNRWQKEAQTQNV
ncbi:MBL fold metallo-hydrolase [Bacillus massiliigorillae]|uniref:MBL fold metallo-hydrolase n=1 Tax=Bacillus massiliigorillae TaxID=1243664 RepID=UPI00039FE587|nr:MBL fold metallo-hydrolase [Bacillus massiliigorillae]